MLRVEAEEAGEARITSRAFRMTRIQLFESLQEEVGGREGGGTNIEDKRGREKGRPTDPAGPVCAKRNRLRR